MHHTRGPEVRRPNPLTDELSDETKAELAAVFADMRRRFAEREQVMGWRREAAILNDYSRRVRQRDTYTERLTGRRGW